MATVFDISAEVPQETVSQFLAACDRYREELGNSQAVAVRRGTIALVRGLRARTKRSRKIAPMSAVTRNERPRYITPKGHNQKPVPAWRIARRGGKDAVSFIHAADTRGEARRRFGQYSKWGLAKHSWGWFMRALFHRAEQTGGNPKTKIDARMTEGYLREIVTGKNPRVEVLIVNKLDYIREAIPPGALSEAMAKAVAYINGQFAHGHAKARKELE